jgi:hypothetical protein
MQRCFISRRALALIKHGLITMQSKRCQRAQNVVCRTRHAARRIEVFHAHQPRAVMMFCVEITTHGSDERAEV